MTGERGRHLAQRMLSSWRKVHGRPKAVPRRSPLEELLIGILADGTSDRRAVSAMERLMEHFVDWNEVRVGSDAEISSQIEDLPDPLPKAHSIRVALDRIVARATDMDVSFLEESEPHKAAELVNGIPGFPENALSRVTVLMMKHEVMPPTERLLEICKRVGLLGDGDRASHAASLRKLVPKVSMYEFHALAFRHAQDFCKHDAPECERCVLRLECRWSLTEQAAARKKAHEVAVKNSLKRRAAQKAKSADKARSKSNKPGTIRRKKK